MNIISDQKRQFRKNLLSLISYHFSLEEFKTLCFKLGVDFDNLPGTNKEGKIRELIILFERLNLIDNLLNELIELHPQVIWPKDKLPNEKDVIILEEPIKSVQILLDTDRIYGKAYGDEIVGELSKTLNIPRDKIHILTAFRGSLGLVIFMPSSAAHKLYILSSQRDQSLLDIRMIKCELENCLPITLKISSQDSDIQLAVYQNNLGNVYLAEGNAKKALPIFSKSFKILQRINTQESLLILSETLQSLGRAFVSLSNTQLAIKYFEQSLTLNFELFGTNHYTSADILEQLAKIQETLGKYDTSVAIFKNVLEIRESAFETIHPKILNSLYRIGSIHFQTLNHSKAKEYFQRIITLLSGKSKVLMATNMSIIAGSNDTNCKEDICQSPSPVLYKFWKKS